MRRILRVPMEPDQMVITHTSGRTLTCRLLNRMRAMASFMCKGSSGCSTKITFRDFGSVKRELQSQ